MDRERTLLIKGLFPSLTERGKIKIGEKGKMVSSASGANFQLPKKLDYFKVVSLYRGDDGNYFKDSVIHGLYGDTPRELPVRLLYDDIGLNFQCRYACYVGKTQWCSGDGEIATRINDSGQRENYNCPCHRLKPEYSGKDKCKINGCLSVLIDGVDSIGGVWKFRTTGYNTVTGLLSSLTLIKSITGGPIAGIPLFLNINPKTVVSPVDNKVQTVYVVGLEYRGSFDSLQEIGYNKAIDRQKHLIKMEDIENDARRLLSAGGDIVDEDVVDEFYPEQHGDDDTQKQAIDLTNQIKTGTTASAGVSYADEERTETVEPPPPEPDKPEETLFDRIIKSRSNLKGLVLGNLEKVKSMSIEMQSQIKERWEAKGGLGEWPIPETSVINDIDAEPVDPVNEEKSVQNNIGTTEAEAIIEKAEKNSQGIISTAAFCDLFDYYNDRLDFETLEKASGYTFPMQAPHDKREGIVKAWVAADMRQRQQEEGG